MISNLDQELLSSGIEGLDSILRGGFPPNNAYLVKGRPGTGKTSLAMQFLLEGARRGESALYVSFSESRRELEVVAESHGWDIDSIRTVELASSISERATAGSSIFHASDVDLPQSLNTITECVERYEPTRVAVDSLTELYNMAESERHFRRALFQLKIRLEKAGVTTIFVGEQGPAVKTDAESIVHGIIELERETPHYGPQRRRLQVSKLRGREIETGFHDFKILHGGLEVYPRIRPSGQGRRIGAGERAKSGIEALDRLLGGGFDRGSTSLIVGPSGAGKSSVVIQYAVAAAKRGEKTVIYTFDEDPATITRRAENMEVPLSEHLDAGLVRVQSVDAAEMSPGQFAHLVREAVDEGGAQFIAIDSINGYMHAMPSTESLVPHLHDLLTYLGNRGVVMMLVMTLGGLFRGTEKEAMHLSYLADTVLLLRYFEQRGAVRRAITAAKHGTGDHEKLIRELTLGEGGVHIGEPIEEFSGVLEQTPVFEGSSNALNRRTRHGYAVHDDD
jgi:circadian clock protein KaiC